MILRLFDIYYRFFWSTAFIIAGLWLAFFYNFLSPYKISLLWWWVPATIPFALMALIRTTLWLYFHTYQKRFFSRPRVVKFLEEKQEFTLKEFSKASRLPQVVALYFLTHSPKIEVVNEGICIFKPRK